MRGLYLDAKGAKSLGEDHDLVLLDGIVDDLLLNAAPLSAAGNAMHGTESPLVLPWTDDLACRGGLLRRSEERRTGE